MPEPSSPAGLQTYSPEKVLSIAITQSIAILYFSVAQYQVAGAFEHANNHAMYKF